MNANSTRHVVVEPGGEQVAAHVGLHSLGRFADAMALGEALSAAIPTNGRVLLHDRGRVVLQTVLMLAGRGEACTDIEYLRAQPELFGEVPSDSTVYRTFTDDLTPEVVELLQAGFRLAQRGQGGAERVARVPLDDLVTDLLRDRDRLLAHLDRLAQTLGEHELLAARREHARTCS